MVQLLIWTASVTRLFHSKRVERTSSVKAKILSTPMGKIAESLISEGVKLGVSSRGIGSLKQTREGVNVVGDDFMLSTAADIVLILQHQMLSLKVSWKEKSGCGMVESSEKNKQRRLTNRSILWLIRSNLTRRS